MCAALSSSTVCAQQAYFSIEGEITNALGQHQIFFDLPLGATTSDTLFFRTYNNAGLTNAAGDPTQDSDIDPVIDLFSLTAGATYTNDDGAAGTFSDFDALLSWPGVAPDGGGALPGGGLIAADDYRLTFRDFNNDSTGYWGLDAVGPANKLILQDLIPSAANPGGVSVIRSLKFGTTSLAATPATFDYTGLSDLIITNGLVLNNQALLQHDQGEITVGGTLQININSVYNLAAGTLDLDGDLDIQSGTMAVSSGATLDRATGTSVNITNGGSLNHTPDTSFSGTDLNISGGGSASFSGFFGLGTSGTTGNITVSGTGSSFTIDSALNAFWAQSGGTANLTVQNNATANISFAGGTVLADGGTDNSNATFDILTGGNLTISSLNLADGGGSNNHATINVDGAGSAVTMSGASTLVIGGTTAGNSANINISNGGVYTTGTGLTTINTNGSVVISTGSTFNTQGNLTVDGGVLNVQSAGNFDLDSGKTLSGINNAQIDTSGTWFLNGSQAISLASGANMRHAGQLSVGTINGPGTLTVSGIGTSMDVDGVLDVARQSGTGIVTINSNAILTAGELHLNEIGSGPSNATIEVLGGAMVTLDSYVSLGVLSGNEDYDGTGLLRISGTGSSLTQLADSLLVGNTDPENDGGSHQLAIENNGVYNTAAGTTEIRKTGTLSVSSSGIFNAHGNIDLIGGTININTSGGIQFAANKTLTASAHGKLNFNDNGYRIDGGGTFNINEGADLKVDHSLWLGYGGTAGTLVVDGVGSTLAVNNTAQTVYTMRIGVEGTGTATLRNSATGTIVDDLWIANITSGAHGTLSIQSGATLSVGTIRMSTNNEGTSLLNVTGTASTLTQLGAATLNVGSAGNSSATINITDAGVFSTGTGLTAINANGSVSVTTGGTFHAKGDLAITDGSLTVDAVSTFDPDGNITVNGGVLNDAGGSVTSKLKSNKTLVASNGATITTNSTWLLDNGAGVDINSGSSLNQTGQFSVSSSNGNGTLTATGSGSSITVNGILVVGQGSVGIVTIQDHASLTQNNQVHIADQFGFAGTSGTLDIQSDADVTLGSVFVGSVDGAEGTGTINLDGAGSTLTQAGTSSLNLGNADTPGNGGVHAINVTDNAVFTTGTGATTIRKTGTLNINTGGIFNANGDFNVIGGAVDLDGDENRLVLAAGQSFTASDTAQVHFIQGYVIQNSASFTFNSGSKLIVQEYFDVRQGTLTVDGVGTTVMTNQSDDTEIDWGTAGTTSVVTVSNGAQFSIGSDATLQMSDSAGVGSGSTLSILSDADFMANGITVGIGIEGVATITVDGAGSTLAQSGTSELNVGSGALANGAGTVSVTAGGAFTTGTGAVNFNPTGTLKIAGGDFTATGPMAINGGTLHKVISGPLDPAVDTNAGLTIAAGSTLKVELDPGLVVGENDSFEIINSVADATSFDVFEGRIIGGGLYFEQTILNISGKSRLFVIATIAQLGDTDYDGDIDDFDLINAIVAYTGSLEPGEGVSTWEGGDTDGDRDTDDFDLINMIVNYTGSLPATATVPEPATLFAFALLGAPLIARRRRV